MRPPAVIALFMVVLAQCAVAAGADSPETLAEQLLPHLEGNEPLGLLDHWDRAAFEERHAADFSAADIDAVVTEEALRSYTEEEGGPRRAHFIGRRDVDGDDGLLFRLGSEPTFDYLYLTLVESEGQYRWVDLRALDDGISLSSLVDQEAETLRAAYSLGYIMGERQLGGLQRLKTAIAERAPQAGKLWRDPDAEVWQVRELWPLAIQALSTSSDPDHLATARRALAERHPSPTGTELLIAENLVRMRAWEPALEALESARTALGPEAWLMTQQARCLSKMGRSDDALRATSEAIELEPSLAAAWRVELACRLGQPGFVERVLEAESATGLDAKGLLDAKQFKRFKKSKAFKAYKSGR